MEGVEQATTVLKAISGNKGSYVAAGATTTVGVDQVYHILPVWFPTGELAAIAGSVLTITLIIKNWLEIRRDMKKKKEE